jgi:hypothetical protein
MSADTNIVPGLIGRYRWRTDLQHMAERVSVVCLKLQTLERTARLAARIGRVQRLGNGLQESVC